MFELGWVRDVGDGTFCRPCAHVLRIVRVVEYCTWCKTPMVEEERADSEGWAYYADPLGELHPCCPGCLAEHFGITARISLHEA